MISHEHKNHPVSGVKFDFPFVIPYIFSIMARTTL